MKKLLIGLVSIVTFAAAAADFSSASLLSGTALRVLDNTTITPTTTNAYYAKLDGITYTYSFTSTNVILLVTNGVTGAGTNATVVNTNFVSGSALASVPVVPLQDGGVNSNATLQANVYAAATGQTNTFTITLERSADGVYFDSGSSAMVMTCYNASPTVTTYVTNVPAAFLTGVKAIRVKSVVTDNHASDGTNFISGLKFNQWVP